MTFGRQWPFLLYMKVLLALALVLAPSTVRADNVWHVGGGVNAPIGAGFSFDSTWRIGHVVSVGVHGLALVDLSREAARTQIGPVIAFQIAPRSFASVSGGIVYDYAKTLHATDGNVTGGASLALRFGVGETGRTALGIEVNWIPELRVYRDLYQDVGGVDVLLTIGRQGF